MSTKDFRIFYDKRGKDWIICNDYKYRLMIDKGCSKREAKQLSHGHINKKETAEKIMNNILSNKRTKSRELRIIGCYVRVTDKTYRHHDWICGLHNTKIDKLT